MIMRVWKAQQHLQHIKNDQRVMMIFLLILLSNVFDHKVRPAPYPVPPAMAHHHPSPLPCLLQYPAMTRMIPARLRIPICSFTWCEMLQRDQLGYSV